jgi:DNA invertase Pin-like site-specific DNA recombinase
MCIVQGVELLEIVVDAGASAKDLNRPGIQRILELVDARAVSVVIIPKLDRLTRSVRDLGLLLERLQRREVSLVSLADSLDTATASGRLVLNIMTSVAQWEREAVGERTKDVIRHKRSKGERIGTVPYGFQVGADGVRLELHLREQETLLAIQSMREAGRPFQAIADALNGQGIATRAGSAWRWEYVRSVQKSFLSSRRDLMAAVSSQVSSTPVEI